MLKRLSLKLSLKVPQKASAIACKVVEHLVVFHGGAALFQLFVVVNRFKLRIFLWTSGTELLISISKLERLGVIVICDFSKCSLFANGCRILITVALKSSWLHKRAHLRFVMSNLLPYSGILLIDQQMDLLVFILLCYLYRSIVKLSPFFAFRCVTEQ